MSKKETSPRFAFFRAMEILHDLAGCRGNNPGPEEDAECDALDSLLSHLYGLEWEYNIELEEHGSKVLLWEWQWKPLLIAEESMRRLRKDLKGTIVRRVKAGGVEYV